MTRPKAAPRAPRSAPLHRREVTSVAPHPIALMLLAPLELLSFKRHRKQWLSNRRVGRALKELASYPKHPDSPLHSLPGRLIVSLTSYPGRFAKLHLTLKSLLDQTVRPDEIVLWVAHEDETAIPQSVRELASARLTVRTCDDIRNFKKIIPSLHAFPSAFIITVDDDTYYPDDWLESLVATYDPEHPTIVCHRAHRITYTRDGRLAPYRRWRRSVIGGYTHLPRTDLLPTGNGGVLYPPGSLPPQTTDLDLIRKLSATSDDVWLYFMWRQAGWSIKRVPRRMNRFLEWPETQSDSLRLLHRTGKKDEHLQAMAAHFGVP